MKDFINFYYGINIDSIKKENDYYRFDYNGDIYYLIPFNQNASRINYYQDFTNRLLKYNIQSHIIMINKDNNYISNMEDVNYILLKTINKNDEISIIDIYNYQKLFLNEKIMPNKNYTYWSSLWAIKNDFLESSLKELKKDKIIDLSFDYYIGLSENAIIYYNMTVNNYKNNNNYLTWCHKRVYYPNQTINYFNPISYIYDYEVRDIAEYLKETFFVDKNIAYDELNTYLKICRLDNYKTNLLFARLLYPSYYFDMLEKWINNKCESSKLIGIISKQKEYEVFLKDVYNILSSKALLFSVDYLI